VQTDSARLFELSQTSDKKPEETFLPRFSQLVFIMQIPRLDVYEEMAKLKGSALTDADKEEIDMRMEYAKKWLETHAPDRYRYELQETLPPLSGAKELTDLQKQFLKALSDKLSSIEWEGELIHGSIHEIVKGSEEYTPKDCFQAIYKIFLAKEYGPQVGWFFSALEKDFVVNRLNESI